MLENNFGSEFELIKKLSFKINQVQGLKLGQHESMLLDAVSHLDLEAVLESAGMVVDSVYEALVEESIVLGSDFTSKYTSRAEIKRFLELHPETSTSWNELEFVGFRDILSDSEYVKRWKILSRERQRIEDDYLFSHAGAILAAILRELDSILASL